MEPIVTAGGLSVVAMGLFLVWAALLIVSVLVGIALSVRAAARGKAPVGRLTGPGGDWFRRPRARPDRPTRR